jgi:3-isopropylmalate dehydrogenase
MSAPIKAKIVALPGDGIGPEIVREGVRVLRAVAQRFGHEFQIEEHLIGGAAIDATQSALPTSTLSACGTADAVLLGAVGGPKWSDPNAKVRPEQGLLTLRKALALFANLRPVSVHPDLLDVSPIKPEVLKGTDIMVVRELTGGIYFGEKQRTAARTRSRRFNVSPAWRGISPVDVASRSSRSTRRTYSRHRDSGARSSKS